MIDRILQRYGIFIGLIITCSLWFAFALCCMGCNHISPSDHSLNITTSADARLPYCTIIKEARDTE